jgi:hypothetical protein
MEEKESCCSFHVGPSSIGFMRYVLSSIEVHNLFFSFYV